MCKKNGVENSLLFSDVLEEQSRQNYKTTTHNQERKVIRAQILSTKIKKHKLK